MKRKKKDQKIKEALEEKGYTPLKVKQVTRVTSFDYRSNGELNVQVSDGWVPGPWSPVTDVPQRHRDALRSWLGAPTEAEMDAARKTARTYLDLHDLGHDGPVACAAHDEGQWCCVDKIENVGRTPTDPVGERTNAFREALEVLLR